jgi:hypothetical protein
MGKVAGTYFSLHIRLFILVMQYGKLWACLPRSIDTVHTFHFRWPDKLPYKYPTSPSQIEVRGSGHQIFGLKRTMSGNSCGCDPFTHLTPWPGGTDFAFEPDSGLIQAEVSRAAQRGNRARFRWDCGRARYSTTADDPREHVCRGGAVVKSLTP